SGSWALEKGGGRREEGQGGNEKAQRRGWAFSGCRDASGVTQLGGIPVGARAKSCPPPCGRRSGRRRGRRDGSSGAHRRTAAKGAQGRKPWLQSEPGGET